MRCTITTGHAFRFSWAGLILIVLGVLFLANTLGYGDFGDLISTWWPVILILIGLSQLLSHGGGRGSGIVMLLIGGLFLLYNLGVLSFSPWQLWPVFLIVIGLSMMMHHRAPAPRSSDEDAVNANVVLSSFTRVITSQAFRGGSLSTFMGSLQLDMRKARPVAEGADLHVSVSLGAVEILAPPDWEVKLDSVPLLGSVDDRRPRADVAVASPAPRLRVHGSIALGSVEVRS